MKLNVAVFFGGESVEHEVSIISANQAIHALDKDKYNVIPVYVSKDRRLFCSELMFDVANFTDLNHLLSESTQVVISKEDNRVVIRPVKAKLFGQKELGTIDVAIPVMHGTNGEDGTIQGYLEMLKVPYAGCDLYGAAIGQDKVVQKHILSDNNIPITNWFWCYAEEMDEHPEEVLKKARKLIYPVILKPARTGSSVGISIAHNDEEYMACFDEARQFDEKIITEKVVKPMVEINCSVLGSCHEAKASVLEQVGGSEEFLTFQEKYLSGSKSSKGTGSKGMASTARIVPAPLPQSQTEMIQDIALKTFKILNASGVCRIDFMMDEETKKVYVNEINTIPGSLAFYLWEATGMPFDQLMDNLVQLALDRQRRREKMTFSYETNILSNFTAGGTKGAKGAKR